MKLLASLVGAMLALGPISPAQARSNQELPSGPVPGLILQVGPEVDAAEISAESPTPLREFRELTGGIRVFRFAHPTTEAFAQRVADQLSAVSGVKAVSVDGALSPATVNPATAVKVLVSTKVQPSTVQSLRFNDNWSSATPQLGAAHISWRPPQSLAGGKLVRYQVYRSTDNGLSYQLYAKTSNRSIVASRLVPGLEQRFRVAAVVKKSGAYYLGKLRSIALVATAAPRKPVLTSPVEITHSSKVSWMPQSPIQRGGLEVSYRVTASSGTDKVECQTTSSSCTITLPPSGLKYQLTVTATNFRGSTSSAVATEVKDDLFARQWYLDSAYGVNARNAWSATEGSKAVTVAVIDTGVTKHSELGDALITNNSGSPYGFDFVSDPIASRDSDGWDADPTDPGDYTSTTPSSWHGTKVASLIAAAREGSGMVGVAPNAQVLAVRAIGADGGRLSDLLAAISWSAGLAVSDAPVNLHPAKIINLSLAGEAERACDANSQSVFNRVFEQGVSVVVAAGNGTTDVSKSFPANCQGVISVAASNRDGQLANYSNFGAKVTVAAPGGDARQTLIAGVDYGVLVAQNEGSTSATSEGYGLGVGTSLAAPLVSGTLALMFAVNPNLNAKQVSEILIAAAKPFATGSPCLSNGACGAGILDAAVAVELAQLAKR